MPENNLGKPPLFAVGEEVLLCCKSYPELNGPAIVEDIATGLFNGAEDWGYSLNVKAPDGRRCKQSALRKKPKPSEFSFSSLMEHLKTEVVRPV